MRRIRRGVAVAIDYALDPVVHRTGTLTGYRDGRQARPVPDGLRDLTAHVALEACAAAGVAAGATATVICAQRAALRALGVDAARPTRELAMSDPGAYVRALQRSSDAAELTAPDGLGGFGWVVQAVGVGLPPVLEHVAPAVGQGIA